MAKPTPKDVRRLILLPKGIRSKLLWAFLLMSVVPLVMLFLVAAWFALPYVREFYHLERWFPLIDNPRDSTWWLVGLIGLTVAIALLGSLYLGMKVVEPVIHLSHKAKRLAEGHFDHELPVERDDEVGDLTSVLNQLTSRIRENMFELKQFGERTTQLNLEIHKRVVTLSGLLQIGELISNGAELNVVLDLMVEKLAQVDGQGFSFLCLQVLEDLPVTRYRASGIEVSQLKALAFEPTQTLIDSNHAAAKPLHATWEQLDRPNLLLQPVLIRNHPVGVLGTGNRHAGYRWSPELVDLAAVFGKQVSIAIENELLLRKTKALSIHDELTGLYNETYLHQRLEEEIKRAVLYQRPCAFAIFAIPEFANYRQRRGEPEAERTLKKVARLVQESVSEVDRVGRLKSNGIGVLLPERNKRQALEIVEQIRRKVIADFSAAPDPHDRLTFAVGVAENPLDGATADELVSKASSTLQHLVPQEPTSRRDEAHNG